MTSDVGTRRDARNAPEAAISAGTGRAARRSRPAIRRHRLITVGIELDAVARLLRSRRFHERLIVGGIVLAALSRLARENQARTLARLAAWDKRRNPRSARTAKARPA